MEKTTINYKNFWEKEAGVYQKIYKIGLEEYAKYFIPNLYWAFSSVFMSVACMDDGITDGKMRIGGSGIFEFKTLEDVADVLLAANVDLVTTHEDCGGARLAYAEKHRVSLESISDEQVDQFSIAWGIALADRLNELIHKQNKYKQIFHRHIKNNELNRPKNFHPARMLYLNATKNPFNPSRVIGLPCGYVISRSYLTATQAQNFATRAIAISFSKIGFQTWITEANPFIVGIVTNIREDGVSFSALKEEIMPVIAPYGNKVIIDSLTTNWLAF
jgi:hypothetical protein